MGTAYGNALKGILVQAEGVGRHCRSSPRAVYAPWDSRLHSRGEGVLVHLSWIIVDQQSYLLSSAYAQSLAVKET